MFSQKLLTFDNKNESFWSFILNCAHLIVTLQAEACASFIIERIWQFKTTM